MQVYLALTDGEKVLIAKKKIINNFWQNTEGNAVVVNQPGQWALPGGGQNGNEEVETTAIREFTEETGISLTPDNYRILQTIRSNDPSHYTDFTLVVFFLDPESLETILRSGNHNIATRTNITDAELETLELQPISNLSNYLGIAVTNPPEYEDQINAAINGVGGRPRPYLMSIDWYKVMADMINDIIMYQSSHTREPHPCRHNLTKTFYREEL